MPDIKNVVSPHDLSDVYFDKGNNTALKIEYKFSYNIATLRTASNIPDVVFVTDSGQQGIFQYDSTDTTSTDDGTTVIVNGTKRYKKVSSSGVYKYSKEYHIDPVNGLDTNDGSEFKPFKTLAKANTVADNSGVKIVLHTGTYVESVNFAQQNIDIVGFNTTTSGLVYIQGTLTMSAPASSQRIKGIMIDNLIQSDAGSLYVNECNLNTQFNKNGIGYCEILNSEFQPTTSVNI